ncbi:hypothetical protein IAT40_002638 [Kwoniella sp. CBS 6097]
MLATEPGTTIDQHEQAKRQVQRRLEDLPLPLRGISTASVTRGGPMGSDHMDAGTAESSLSLLGKKAEQITTLRAALMRYHWSKLRIGSEAERDCESVDTGIEG